jgi:ElaA protein
MRFADPTQPVVATAAAPALDSQPKPFVAGPLRWACKRLPECTPLELHRIHRARQEVFVVEQNCAFQDADTTDEVSWHLTAWRMAATPGGADSIAPGTGSSGDDPGELLAYARLVPPGVKYVDASIGRVITTGAARGQGLGRELVRRAIAQVGALYPEHAIRISAQSRLEIFYQQAGFVVAGPRYLEDGIDHTEMVRVRQSVGS